MGLNRGFYHIQPQANAILFIVLDIEADIATEEIQALLGRDAGATVGDGDAQPALRHADRQFNRAAKRAVFAGIDQQVDQHLGQPPFVRCNAIRRSAIQPMRLSVQRKRLAAAIKERLHKLQGILNHMEQRNRLFANYKAAGFDAAAL